MDVEKQLDIIRNTLKSIPMNELVVLTGGNGKGKSLIRKQMPFSVQNAFPDEVTEQKLPRVCKSVSMQLRTESQPEFGALASMTHDIPWMPTSIETYNLLKQMFKCISDNEKFYFIIDEPEIGMSRESQLGIANFILTQYEDNKDKMYGMLVITHSETIVKALKDTCVFINLDGIDNVDTWLNREIIPTDFELLQQESDELFHAVQNNSKPHKAK